MRSLRYSSYMGDTRSGRAEQARDAENRQRERELAEELARSEELPPPELPDEPRVCHYRGCNELATFRVVERYQEETGKGAVTAEAFMCEAHADDESPTNLRRAYAEYVFLVEPLPDTFDESA